MKLRLVYLVLFHVTLVSGLAAQDYSGLEKIELKDKESCSKNEDKVIECCDYILNSPINLVEKDENRMNAVKFIMRWMDQTPDYNFSLDESTAKVINTTPSLLGVMLASMAQYAIKKKTDDANDLKYNSFVTFIKYCENPENKVSLDDELKELIKAKHENNLKQYLQIKSEGVIAML
ncbi:MAG TPA: hypothetical protein VK179_09375 [Bacteroidales bacterium]|nr:hypothetical protein [Bacteroidales bacterium]